MMTYRTHLISFKSPILGRMKHLDIKNLVFLSDCSLESFIPTPHERQSVFDEADDYKACRLKDVKWVLYTGSLKPYFSVDVRSPNLLFFLLTRLMSVNHEYKYSPSADKLIY